MTREDLVAVAAAYERSARRVERVGLAGVLGGLALGATLLLARGSLGWAAWLDPLFFAGGWAIGLAFAASAWRRQRGLLAKFQLHCPHCQHPILTARPWRAEVSRAQLVASAGTCPSCGGRVVDS